MREWTQAVLGWLSDFPRRTWFVLDSDGDRMHVGTDREMAKILAKADPDGTCGIDCGPVVQPSRARELPTNSYYH